MAALKRSPKSPKSHLPGKYGPEIPAPSIETGENGERERGSEFGGALSLEPIRVHPFDVASPSWPATAATFSTT